MEIVSLGAIAIGLINVGSADAEASSTLLQRLIELTPQKLSSTYSRLKTEVYLSNTFHDYAGGFVWSCFSQISTAGAGYDLHGLPRHHRRAFSCAWSLTRPLQACCTDYAGGNAFSFVKMLYDTIPNKYYNHQHSKIFHWSQVCAYAGTGDVLIVQGLLRICSEPANGEGVPVTPVNSPTSCCCDQRSRIIEFSEKRTKEKLEEKHAESK